MNPVGDAKIGLAPAPALAAAAGAKGGRLTAQDYIHRLIVRDFGAPHGRFVGWIDRYFDESQTATREQLWQVVYEDGDKEDLNQTELSKYLQPKDNTDIGEFVAVTFPEGPLGLTIGPAEEAAALGQFDPKDVFFYRQGNTAEDRVKVTRTWVISTKHSCSGRGLLSHSDSVVLMGWQSNTRNLDFDSCCKALRTLPRPLTVIFKRSQQTILQRKERKEKCLELFRRAADIWSSATEPQRKLAFTVLRSENMAKFSAKTKEEQDSDRLSMASLENEFSVEFIDAFLRKDMRALHWHHTGVHSVDRTSDVRRFKRMAEVIGRANSGHDENANTTALPNHAIQVEPVANPKKRRRDKASLAANHPPAAPGTIAPREALKKQKTEPKVSRVPSVNHAHIVQSNIARPPEKFPMDSYTNAADSQSPKPEVQRFYNARLDYIKSPSNPLQTEQSARTEPVLTQALSIGTIPVILPQRGLHVWAFLNSQTARALGVGSKAGHYRATILSVKNAGQSVKLCWYRRWAKTKFLGENSNPYVSAAALHMWAPAPSATALYIYLSTCGKHLVCLEPVSQNAAHHNFAKLRDAIQTRFGHAVRVAHQEFTVMGMPHVPLQGPYFGGPGGEQDDIEWSYKIDFVNQRLGIGIDQLHGDRGIQCTSVRDNYSPLLQQIQANVDYVVAAGAYRAINGGLEELIHHINVSGRPLTLFFLRGSDHPKFKVLHNLRSQGSMRFPKGNRGPQDPRRMQMVGMQNVQEAINRSNIPVNNASYAGRQGASSAIQLVPRRGEFSGSVQAGSSALSGHSKFAQSMSNVRSGTSNFPKPFENGKHSGAPLSNRQRGPLKVSASSSKRSGRTISESDYRDLKNALGTVNKMSKKSADLEKKLEASKEVIAHLRHELNGLNGTAKYLFTGETKHFLLDFKNRFPPNAIPIALQKMSPQEMQDYKLRFVEPYLNYDDSAASNQGTPAILDTAVPTEEVGQPHAKDPPQIVDISVTDSQSLK